MQPDEKQKKVAFLAGGYSPEGAVAVWSAKYLEKIFEGDKEYRPYLIHVNQNGWYYENTKNEGKHFHIDRNDFSLTLPNEGKIKFDLAVLLIGGAPGEDGQIQGYLQMSNVPFIGCGLLSSGMIFF
jgi:D-alanine-D-alanine ligase